MEASEVCIEVDIVQPNVSPCSPTPNMDLHEHLDYSKSQQILKTNQ